MSVVVNVVLLSLVAGLATGLGGLIALIRKPGQRLFGFLMGAASGVMITLSFVELVAEAWQLSGYLVATIGFALGASLMMLVDILTPHIRFGERETDAVNSHVASEGPLAEGDRSSHAPRLDARLLKTGLLIAIGISIHNMPEGMAVGAGYMHLPQFGAFIALAIALHNIPEGIATALPLCQAGVCRRDSFLVAFLSGLVEPIGALLAATVLGSFSTLIPAALAFAGGVMVFITLDELVPTAREYGHQHFTAIGIILGAVFVFLLSGTMGV